MLRIFRVVVNGEAALIYVLGPKHCDRPAPTL